MGKRRIAAWRKTNMKQQHEERQIASKTWTGGGWARDEELYGERQFSDKMKTPHSILERGCLKGKKDTNQQNG